MSLSCILSAVVLIVLLFLPVVRSPLPPGTLPAFPGAEGFGALAVGGRGGRVFEVTNLNDSGVGSLRACVQASVPRTCIFKVGGTIALHGPLTISSPFLTIAGQTAPGGGIVLRSLNGETGIVVASHDVIIRYISVRPGPGGENQAILISKNGGEVHDVIVDHASLSWATDEVLTTWYGAHDISLQWNLVAEGLSCSSHPEGCHSMGTLLGGYAASEEKNLAGAYNISYHHNLNASNGERNPLVKNRGVTDITNNVAYNPNGTFSHVDEEHAFAQSLVNYAGNYFKSGPNTAEKEAIKAINLSQYGAAIYISDNVVRRRGYPAICDVSGTGVVQSGTQSYLVPQPNPVAYPIMDRVSPYQAYELVLAGAGNNQGLDATGHFFKRRDAVDQRILQEVRLGEGKIIDAPGASSCVGACRGAPYTLTTADYALVGVTERIYTAADEAMGLGKQGWPIVEVGTPYPDADYDGMPDQWEAANGLDPNSALDNNFDRDGDGYTNLEEYLNGTIP